MREAGTYRVTRRKEYGPPLDFAEESRVAPCPCVVVMSIALAAKERSPALHRVQSASPFADRRCTASPLRSVGESWKDANARHNDIDAGASDPPRVWDSQSQACFADNLR